MFDNSSLTLAFRHAIRSLKQSPTFTIAVVLTFAVGIGATTAVFSVINAALLTPLPYPNASRLIALQQTRKGDEISVSFPDFQDFQSQSASLSQVAAFVGRSFTLTGDGQPERIRGQMVTANLFSTLGVRPIVGREFTAAEDQLGAAEVLEISYDLWMRRFAGDRSIVGRTIPIDGRQYTVVGVMPQGFHFPDGIVFGSADVWAPFSLLTEPDRSTRDSHPGLVAVGLLRPGRSIAGARSELAAIATRLAAEYPESNRDIGVKVDRAVDVIVGSLRESLILLFASVGLVLLIACANVAGLVLTRADGRRREVAVKAALGASAWRMVGNLIAEGAVLATLGGVAGVVFAVVFLRAFAPAVADLPRLATLTLDWRAVAFAMGLTVIAGISSSVTPAAWAGRVDLERWLRTRGTSHNAGASARNGLVVTEVALSLVLLVVASLLLRSFEHLRAESGGIDPRGVLTFSLRVPDSSYTTAAQKTMFFSQAAERFAAIPGVVAAGAVSILPFGGSGAQSGIGIVGTGRDGAKRTDVQVATPDYFRAIGITLVAGRLFNAADDANAPKVAVVDERFASAMWPGQSALGKHVEGWGFQDLMIIGVVHHVKNYGVSAESRQELYVALAQRPSSRLTFAVRTSGDPSALVAPARRVVAELDRNLPMYDVLTMDNVVGKTVAGPRLAALLSTGYSAVALCLVIIGIYGVMAYLVARRTREIGVRIALGARPSHVLGLVLGQTLRLTGIGAAIGVAAALGVSQLVRSMLFGVTASDPLTLVAATAGIIITSLVASAVPAIRATRVSPLVALSDDA